MDLNNTPEPQVKEEAKGPISKTLLYFGYPANEQNIQNSDHWHKSELYPNALIQFFDGETAGTPDSDADPRNLLERVSDECLMKALSLLKDAVYFPSSASEIKDLVSAAIAADNANSSCPPPRCK